MIARLTILHVKPEKMEECLAFGREQVRPARTQVQGFLRDTILVDRQNHKIVQTTLWDSEVQMRLFVDSPESRQRQEALKPWLSAPPIVETLEVLE